VSANERRKNIRTGLVWQKSHTHVSANERRKNIRSYLNFTNFPQIFFSVWELCAHMCGNVRNRRSHLVPTSFAGLCSQLNEGGKVTCPYPCKTKIRARTCMQSRRCSFVECLSALIYLAIFARDHSLRHKKNCSPAKLRSAEGGSETRINIVTCSSSCREGAKETESEHNRRDRAREI